MGGNTRLHDGIAGEPMLQGVSSGSSKKQPMPVLQTSAAVASGE